jgi:predicted deacylase
MKRHDHPLLNDSICTARSVTSFHFAGTDVLAGRASKKVYLQASLHAEELPGMLALVHLMPLLEAAEANGQLKGEVVVVPIANPIGLSQWVDHKPMGRFDLASSENFNRHYPDLAKSIGPEVLPLLGPDPRHNTNLIRKAALAFLQQWQAMTELQSLRKTLLSLSVDADVVLDLHCDCEAVMHLYTETECWPTLQPLACLLQARAVLLAQDSGGQCFDECLSNLWSQLSTQAAALPSLPPVAQACASATIELRGEGDVSHAFANADARALFAFLTSLGVIQPHGNASVVVPLPLCEATPLAGAQAVRTPVPGLVVFAATPGDVLAKGDLVAEVINPLQQPGMAPYRVLAEVDGVFYARSRDRYAKAHDELGNIAGATPFRTGPLLGA